MIRISISSVEDVGVVLLVHLQHVPLRQLLPHTIVQHRLLDLQALVERQAHPPPLQDLLAHLRVGVQQLQAPAGPVQPQRKVELRRLFALHLVGDVRAEPGVGELRAGNRYLVVLELPRAALLLALVRFVLVGDLDAFEVG